MTEAPDMFQITVTFLNKDGTENAAKKPVVTTLAAIGGSVEVTARQVWREAGSPKPCTVEVLQVVTDFNVDASGEWDDLSA